MVTQAPALTSNKHLLVHRFSGALCVCCLATVVTLVARKYAVNSQRTIVVTECVVS